ncbi:MAG: sodium ion-translocating decarboxylase subunit beta [Dehalococcoidia bacterium]|nr:MAG: sodium ion-translocating decarboxylase subunit beta [Dehalococcoidia bacterium]
MLGFFEVGFLNLTWGSIVMLIIGGVLLYLGIAKNMEPLLLVPIGFGVLLVNLPLGGLMESIVNGQMVESYAVGGEPAGIISRIFRYGLAWEIIPCFIFLGLGAMTDFGPLIANPKTLILGAGAQFGVYFAFFVALLLGFSIQEACSIGIIGGADGPTTIYLTNKLAPHFIGATAVAAYTYMALVPIIQPPVIKLLTTKKEREIYMKPQLRPVSKLEKVLFPAIAAIIIILLVPKSAPLIGMFMFGNLLFVSGVTDRLADTAANAFMNILTILLGLCVGCFMSAENFLRVDSLMVFGLGIVAYATSTAFGVSLAKLMNLVTKEKINPMIGAAGVSAVPMAARVVQRMGQQANPKNFLLMHAMGPNIAGVIGTATAAGIFLGMVG